MHPADTEASRRRIALITGASRRRGIGASVCRALAARGINICFTHWQPFDRASDWGADEDGPAALLAELRAAGVRAEALEVDLSAPDIAARVLDDVTDRLGSPSILINNAAHSTREDYRRLDAATLDLHYAVNFRATALLSAEFARRYPGGPGGRIISMITGQGNWPMPEELAYASSKGAIEAFTVSLSADVGRLGITVNAIDPGPTDTGWMTERLKEALVPRFALGRIGTPEDAARLIAFLVSEDGGWITGQVIHSDGGFRGD